jgi:hypothetical protein
METRRHIAYPMVYLLLKLSLLLPVATAAVERGFSTMNYVKDQLRNRIGDEFLNGCLVTYIENDIFESVENEKNHTTLSKGEAMKRATILFRF